MVRSQGDMGMDGFSKAVKHLQNRNHKPEFAHAAPSLPENAQLSKHENIKLRHIKEENAESPQDEP